MSDGPTLAGMQQLSPAPPLPSVNWVFIHLYGKTQQRNMKFTCMK